MYVMAAMAVISIASSIMGSSSANKAAQARMDAVAKNAKIQFYSEQEQIRQQEVKKQEQLADAIDENHKELRKARSNLLMGLSTGNVRGKSVASIDAAQRQQAAIAVNKATSYIDDELAVLRADRDNSYRAMVSSFESGAQQMKAESVSPAAGVVRAVSAGVQGAMTGASLDKSLNSLKIVRAKESLVGGIQEDSGITNMGVKIARQYQ